MDHTTLDMAETSELPKAPTEKLLLSLPQVAEQLSVSVRTVHRLLSTGQLPTVKIGRSVRVPAQAVRDWIAQNTFVAHNAGCVGPDARYGGTICHIDAKTHRSGGPVTPTQAAAELGGLLGQKTTRKRRPSRPNGSCKRTRRSNGTPNRSGLLIS
jgi:excisionase family DNA binding protein